MTNHTLEVFINTTRIFHSDSKWLHPLFELERFLATTEYDPGDLVLHDKIIGRAAALLIARMGIQKVRAELMSELGKQALMHYNIQYEYKTLVPRIDCQTESLLANEYDVEKAYVLLKERAENSHLQKE